MNVMLQVSHSHTHTFNYKYSMLMHAYCTSFLHSTNIFFFFFGFKPIIKSQITELSCAKAGRSVWCFIMDVWSELSYESLHLHKTVYWLLRNRCQSLLSSRCKQARGPLSQVPEEFTFTVWEIYQRFEKLYSFLLYTTPWQQRDIKQGSLIPIH